MIEPIEHAKRWAYGGGQIDTPFRPESTCLD